MKTYHSSDNISLLNLSVRSTNSLRKARIRTIGEMLALTKLQIKYIPGIGMKSAEEISRVTEALQNGIGCIYIDVSVETEKERQIKSPDDITSYYLDEEGLLYKDVPVKGLPLSPHIIEKLLFAGIRKTSEIHHTTAENLTKLRSIGPIKAKQIANALQTIHMPTIDPVKAFPNTLPCHTAAVELLKSLHLLTSPIIPFAYHQLYRIGESMLSDSIKAASDLLGSERYLSAALDIPAIRNSIAAACKDAAGSHAFGASAADLRALLPRYIVSSQAFTNLIRCEIQSGNLLYNEDGLLEVRRPTLEEYLSSLPLSRNHDIFTARLTGLTYQELACQYGTSRERIRQICNTLTEKLPKVYEDRYKGIFEQYQISQESFISFFHISETGYHYLKQAYKRGETPLNSIEDSSYPPSIMEAIDNTLSSEECIDVQGSGPTCRKQDVLKHILKENSGTAMTMEELSVFYHDYLETNGILPAGNLAFQPTTEEESLRKKDYAIFGFGHTVRYYDYSSREFSDFFQSLHLVQYQNLEISTQKLFRDNRSAMAAYDIRDAFELYDLLKKLKSKITTSDVIFKKSPIICFGRGDRIRQMDDLLHELPPGTPQHIICEKYDALYGFHPSSAARILRKHFKSYLAKYDKPAAEHNLSPGCRERLKLLLSDDFYFKRDALKLFQAEFKESAPCLINDSTFRNLGFIPYSTYIIRDSYPNASTYFRQYLLSKDYWDLCNPHLPIYELPSFTKQLYQLETEYQIIEYEPRKLISKKALERQGIHTADIKEYCDKAAALLKEEEFFTFYSLEERGLGNPFEQFGYGVWFCTSVLARDPRFKCAPHSAGQFRISHPSGSGNCAATPHP